MAMQKRSKRMEATSGWTLLEAFAIEERLTYGDFYRLGALGLLPRIEMVDDTPWVHRPSIVWWRELLKVHNFKTFGQSLAATKKTTDATTTLTIPPENLRPLKTLKGLASPLAELVDEEGRAKVEYAFGLGLPVFAGDGVHLVQRPVFDVLMESRFDPELALGEGALVEKAARASMEPAN
jgi:hypothetical protein